MARAAPKKAAKKVAKKAAPKKAAPKKVVKKVAKKVVKKVAKKAAPAPRSPPKKAAPKKAAFKPVSSKVPTPRKASIPRSKVRSSGKTTSGFRPGQEFSGRGSSFSLQKLFGFKLSKDATSRPK